MKQTLQWANAPNSTTWGAGMKEALIALDKDSTALLFCHVDDLPKLDAALASRTIAAQPEREVK